MRVRGKGKWVAGIHLEGGTIEGVLLRKSGSESSVEGVFHRDWEGMDDPSALRSFLKEYAPGVRPQNLSIVLLLSGAPFAIEVKSFPAMRADDFFKAALWYNRNNRRTDFRKPCFAAWPQSKLVSEEESQEIEGLLLETDLDRVEHLATFARNAGAKESFVVPAPFALQPLVLQQARAHSHRTVLLLNAAEGEGTMTVFEGERLLLHRAVDLGSDSFDLPLADFGGDVAGPEGQSALGTVPNLKVSPGKLLTELERTDQYLESRFATRPDAIVLAERDEEIRRFLSGEVDLPITFLESDSEDREERKGSFPACYGAALRLLEGQSTGLLPQKEPHRRALPSIKLPREAITRGLYRTLPLLLTLFLLTQGASPFLKKKKEGVENRLRSLTKQHADPELEARLSVWERGAVTLNRFRSKQYLWSDLLCALSASVPAGIVVTGLEGGVPKNEDLLLEEVDPLAPPDPLADLLEESGEDDLAEPPWLRIEGTAAGVIPIRQLVRNLDQRREFERVILLSAGIEEREQKDALLKFSISCRPAVERSQYIRSAADQPETDEQEETDTQPR